MVPGTDDEFLLIAYGLGWSEVTPKNLLKCRVNRDGSCEVIEGEGFAGGAAHTGPPSQSKLSQVPKSCERSYEL